AVRGEGRAVRTSGYLREGEDDIPIANDSIGATKRGGTWRSRLGGKPSQPKRRFPFNPCRLDSGHWRWILARLWRDRLALSRPHEKQVSAGRGSPDPAARPTEGLALHPLPEHRA